MKQIFTFFIVLALSLTSFAQEYGCHANFNYTIDEEAGTIEFTDASWANDAEHPQMSANGWNWTIAGQAFTTPNVTYTYSSLPIEVCLTASFENDCEDTYCDTNVTVEPTDPCEGFSVQVDPMVAFVSEEGACDAELTVSATNGTAPFEYNWSNGESTPTITGLCEGNLTVTVLDANGCSASAEGLVAYDDPNNNQNLTASELDTCITFTVVEAYVSNVVITDSTTIQVEWSLVDDQQVTHVFVLTYQFSGQYGDYNVVITITCPEAKSTSQSWNQDITIDENTTNTTGVNLLNSSSSKLNIYPNPVKNILTIEGENNSSVVIMDINGKVVRTISIENTQTTIDVSGLTQGVYFVKTNGKVSKLVKL